MRFRSLLVFAITFRSMLAIADPLPTPTATPPSWIVGTGIGLGGVARPTSPDADGPNIGGVAYAEVEYRPSPRAPIHMRAMFSGGTRTLDTTWSAFRLGAEYRPCDDGPFCAILGVDVGYLHVGELCQDTTSMSVYGCDGPAPDRNGVSVSGRVGFDTGWQHVRVRAVLDYTRALPADDRWKVVQYGATNDLGSFLSFELGVAAVF
jgi:hypothetical protein